MIDAKRQWFEVFAVDRKPPLCGIQQIYLALAVLPDGTRDILGIWIEQTEGAKFWLKVFSDLKARGCQDILIEVTDGLKGMPGPRRRVSHDHAANLYRALDPA